jgi:putative serine protease PepD
MGHGRSDDEPPEEGSSADHESDPELDRDEQADEHATRGAPPAPGDRTWVHPTELPRFMAPEPEREGQQPRVRARSWVAPVVVGASAALAAVVALAVAGTLDSRSGHVAASVARVGSVAGGSAQDVAARTGLSVVEITARDKSGTRKGSGVCVRHEGGLLTTAGIVGTATTVSVETNDGSQHTARVVGRDPTTDLVLLAMTGDAGVPAAQLSDQEPAAGAPVWVVGADDGPSAYLSSPGKVATTDGIAAVAGGPMTGRLLETKIGLEPEAVGGALVGNDGEVVGIVIGRVANSDMTYAMPITSAVTVAEQLRSDGVARHGSAGFTGSDTNAGPTVWKVTPHGPAASAGLEPGDVITAVDGRRVAKIDVVTAIVRALDPGRSVTFAVTRGSRHLEIAVVLAATS